MSRFSINSMIDEIVNDYRAQIRKALKRAEQIAKVRMQEIIQELMIDDYYGGYTPKIYARIYQLPKSVGPYTEIKESDESFIFGFGVEDESPYGPSAMDHSINQIRVVYNTKKSGSFWRAYEYENEDVDEQMIFENFLAGIHPNVGRAGTSHIVERVSKQLEYFLQFEVMDIINSQLNKIK